MEIVIDIDAPDPVFAQLIERIKAAVLNGHLNPGDPLPSIRQLANDLELNSKTVAKAYRLLERDSVVQTRGYRGTFIHPDAKTNSKVDLNVWISSRVEDLVAELRASGATDSEIRIAFSTVLNENNQKGIS